MYTKASADETHARLLTVDKGRTMERSSGKADDGNSPHLFRRRESKEKEKRRREEEKSGKEREGRERGRKK